MKIVVAVSGKKTSHPAIEWALAFAQPGHESVEFVHVVDTTWGTIPDGYLEAALLAAEDQLRDRADRALQDYPEVLVTSHVRVGDPTAEIVQAASGADLLVVGAHPASAHAGVGRRAVRIAAHAPGSVIVVPTDVVPTGTGIVVGIDGSEDSARALAFGAQYADRMHERLTVVYSWAAPEAWGLIESTLLPVESADEDRLVLSEAVAGLAEQYPDLDLVTEVSAASPLRALYGASLGARLVVVGSRGRNGLEKAFLGSVSEDLVADLPCAVAVIRPS